MSEAQQLTEILILTEEAAQDVAVHTKPDGELASGLVFKRVSGFRFTSCPVLEGEIMLDVRIEESVPASPEGT